jgi:hypothetical protein
MGEQTWQEKTDKTLDRIEQQQERDKANGIWKDKTNNTLDRIESQIDSGDKQIGFAQDFREKVIISLAKIEAALVENEKDHKEIKEMVSKIPPMELGLNNHLHTHDMIKKCVYYPVLVTVIAGIIGLFCKIVLKVF